MKGQEAAMAADGGLWGGIIGGGSLAGVIALAKWALGRFKQDGIDEERDKSTALAIVDLRGEITALVCELRSVGEGQRALQISQAGVNDMVAKTLESLADRMERHDDKIQDLSSNSKLMNEHVAMLREQMNLLRDRFEKQVASIQGQLERKADKA